MKTYTVWQNNSVGIKEKCVKDINGDYIGVESGNKYDKHSHYQSSQLDAKIISSDKDNKTGMYHLYKELNDDEDNRKSWKEKFIGCYITVEKAHLYDGLEIYRCLELNEYFSENEIELIK